MNEKYKFRIYEREDTQWKDWTRVYAVVEGTEGLWMQDKDTIAKELSKIMKSKETLQSITIKVNDEVVVQWMEKEKGW